MSNLDDPGILMGSEQWAAPSRHRAANARDRDHLPEAIDVRPLLPVPAIGPALDEIVRADP
jgi:hypothetical protein